MHAHEVLDEITPLGRELRDLVPEVYSGFARMSAAAVAPGALAADTKELIALAIAATRECDGCIAAHAKNLARLGATRAEVGEALGVVIAMNGGPGTVWGPRAFGAYVEFLDSEAP